VSEKFEAWAIVELFGHQRVAGKLAEQTVGGETFIRVDIPQGESAYTRLFGKGAIYCINICEEATARNFASRLSAPLQPYAALPDPSPATEPAGEIAGRYGAAGALDTDRDEDPEDELDDLDDDDNRHF
jgi:hypothetical protein